ncbi:unnamed protein product [Pleuronectes platessa]|uniref:Uncharacterized protein n=1 Tax=Pleuronectes platessa TaxID=8262 RepID=A0A9N7YPW1_PLEPL|nr:unnamed protein product [Pleuronectes platessa]
MTTVLIIFGPGTFRTFRTFSSVTRDEPQDPRTHVALLRDNRENQSCGFLRENQSCGFLNENQSYMFLKESQSCGFLEKKTELWIPGGEPELQSSSGRTRAVFLEENQSCVPEENQSCGFLEENQSCMFLKEN